MKSQLTTILVLVASFAAIPASARSLMPPVMDAQLTKFELDSRLPYASEIQGGNIRINYKTKTATLTLYRGNHCPAHLICTRNMPAPVVVELPIVSSFADTCGTRTVTASQDQRPVDGAFQELKIHDNSHNRCPHFAALPATQVEFITEFVSRATGSSKTYSTFVGDSFRYGFGE